MIYFLQKKTHFLPQFIRISWKSNPKDKEDNATRTSKSDPPTKLIIGSPAGGFIHASFQYGS